MKKANIIIEHLQNTPHLRKLREQKYFNKLKNILPSALKNGIKFIYKKDNILFFVLSHNLFLSEFNYNLKTINKLLKNLEEIEQISLNIKEVKAFISHKPLVRESKSVDTHIKYIESANGDFKNSIKDRELNSIFEKIREDIKLNREDNSLF